MSPRRFTLTLLLLAASAAGHAQSPRTREEVRAELLEAQRTGNVLANGESGLTLRELYPQRYGVAPASGLTRAQVREQLREAQRTGDVLAGGEFGVKLNELNPQAYPPRELVAGKTRAEVQAELREAIRTGDMLADGDSGQLLKDLYPQRYAHVRPAGDAPMQANAGSTRQVR